ncbi:tail tube protein [Synechococcus phage S-B43]|jgi:hypothetical protein|nr:tail tube protein [Synechococcus phage S-B43]QDH50475.1 tail tube protein [Synechococcus phage S-B43]
MAETKTLSQFKSRLAGGGARPNLFEVSIPTFPSAIADAWGSGDQSENGTFKFLCKAAQLPASNTSSFQVPFRGRNLKVAGDRTFDAWTVTIINDEDFQLRTAFERWANTISKLDDATGVTNPSSYMTDAYVTQLGRGAERFATTNEGGNSAVLRTYKFYDIFPTRISEIALSYDDGDQLETFDVEFDIQYFTIGNSLQSTGSNAGEVLIE